MTNDWPPYYKNLLKHGSPDSPVGIITLWTICDSVIKDIDKQFYRVAGQLYTKGGINSIVRNCLANKHIRYLIVCGQDRSGAGNEMAELWENGESEVLHKEIAQGSLHDMLMHVQLINLIGKEDGKEVEDVIRKLDLRVPSYGEPEIFPEPEVKGVSELECAWPAEPSVFRVQGKNIAETWLKIQQAVLKFGDVKETDGMKIKEVLNMAAVVTDEDPDNFVIPPYLGIDQTKVAEYLPQITTGEKNPGVHYTYGNRLQSHFKANQVEKIIEKLQKDPNAREAVGIFFDPNTDHDADHRPCLTLIQFLRNRGRLNLNVYVRSHDLFGGWHLNAFGLRKLQQMICQKASLPMGALTIISASGHIYDFNWDQAQKTVQANLKPEFEQDPRGYFKIDINGEDKKIIAKHYGPEAQLLQTFEQNVEKTRNAAMLLAGRIIQTLAVSSLAHALDLGIELNKAETALRLGISYTQDKPLELGRINRPMKKNKQGKKEVIEQQESLF